MGGLPWVIQMDPTYYDKCPYKREQIDSGHREWCDSGSGGAESVALLTVNMEERDHKPRTMALKATGPVEEVWLLPPWLSPRETDFRLSNFRALS